jgi:hypothetical protein
MDVGHPNEGAMTVTDSEVSDNTSRIREARELQRRPDHLSQHGFQVIHLVMGVVRIIA